MGKIGRPKGAKDKKPRKKGGGGGYKSPCIGNNWFNQAPLEFRQAVGEITLELFRMKDIDMDDPVEVAKRMDDYFALYMSRNLKPTVSGLGIALNNHSREWLHAVAYDLPAGGNGYKPNLRPEVAGLIKRAYKLLETQWETFMNSGKINPASGIFLGKNNFKYQDKVEHVVTPRLEEDSDYSAEDIKKRYVNPVMHEIESGDDDK